MPLKRFFDSAPAAKSGTLTTRTDDDTGVITITAAAPGLNNGDRVDIYWNVGGVYGHRRGMLVSSTGGSGPWTVTVGTSGGDVGTGDVLPIATTPVTICLCQTADFLFDGSDLAALAIVSAGKAIVVLAVAAGTEQYSALHTAGAGLTFWHNALGTANPVTGDAIAKVYVSNGETTVQDIKVGVAVS